MVTAAVSTELPAMRWENHALGRDDLRYGYAFDELIDGAVSAASTSVHIMGLGFDPRATLALERIAGRLPSGSRILAVVPHQRGGASRESAHQEANEQRAVAIASEHGHFLEIISPNDEITDRRFVGVLLARTIQKRAEWESDHVVIDVSSMPSPLIFAITAVWLKKAIANDIQVQVVAADNHWLDDYIGDSGVNTPRFLPGFAFHGEVDQLNTSARVWLPVLGRGKSAQLDEIHMVLKPDEICPIVPFPCNSPRRGDDLFLEYGTLLFEANQVDPRNVIHADAQNPFDLYRSLVRMSRQYRDALLPLGDPTVIPSTHGSKILSLGVLLAAMQEEMSVINAGPMASRLRSDASDDDIARLASRSELTCLWLAGEPQRAVS